MTSHPITSVKKCCFLFIFCIKSSCYKNGTNVQLLESIILNTQRGLYAFRDTLVHVYLRSISRVRSLMQTLTIPQKIYCSCGPRRSWMYSVHGTFRTERVQDNDKQIEENRNACHRQSLSLLWFVTSWILCTFVHISARTQLYFKNLMGSCATYSFTICFFFHLIIGYEHFSMSMNSFLHSVSF